MVNELAALILAMLFALLIVHIVQGASGKGTGGTAWIKSFFAKAPTS